MPSIKGTASVTDNRALNKRLASVKFPANFAEPCNVEAVNRAVMTTWIEERITELLGFEDEIVQSTAVNLFLPSRVPDGPPVTVHPKKAQIHLEGFLGEGPAAEFAAQVYTLLLDAQASRAGVPKQFVEEKKNELEVQKAQAAVVARPRGPYQQQQQQHQQGPPRHRDAWRGGGGGERGPPRHVAERGRGPPPARRSVSPERGGGNGRRDEFGRTSRPADMYRENERPPYDTRRGDNRREGGGRRGGYDRREESPPPYPHTHHHHRRHHHRDRDHDRRPPRGDDRYPGYPRADEHDQDTNNNPDERHRSRRRSRSPPRDNSRSRRRSRSLSSSSSSSGSSSDSSRSSRGGGYRQRR